MSGHDIPFRENEQQQPPGAILTLNLCLYEQVKRGVWKVNFWKTPVEIRFWASVDKDGPEHPDLGKCWVFTRVPTNTGYAHIGYRGRCVGAHRYSWMLHHGQIPEGLAVLHHCDNRVCVNPGHLFLGTCEDNNEDKFKKGRQAKGQDICTNILAPEEVREIRSRYKFYSRTDGSIPLGKEYGVSSKTIRDIVARKSWKHLD